MKYLSVVIGALLFGYSATYLGWSFALWDWVDISHADKTDRIFFLIFGWMPGFLAAMVLAPVYDK